MTHFLEVGSLREGLHEVYEHAAWMQRLLAMSVEERTLLEQRRGAQGDMTSYHDDVRTALTVILQRSQEMKELVEQFESAPIIYTGGGSTAEVLSMLERLMAGRQRT
jgi:hypothetical protein